MTRAAAADVYPGAPERTGDLVSYRCTASDRITVGFASASLLRSFGLPRSTALAGRIVLIETSSVAAGVDGVHVGDRLTRATRGLRVGQALRFAGTDWYLAATGGVTVVLRVSGGVVREVGIAERQLTATQSRRLAFIRSFS